MAEEPLYYIYYYVYQKGVLLRTYIYVHVLYIFMYYENIILRSYLLSLLK